MVERPYPGNRRYPEADIGWRIAKARRRFRDFRAYRAVSWFTGIYAIIALVVVARWFPYTSLVVGGVGVVFATIFLLLAEQSKKEAAQLRPGVVQVYAVSPGESLRDVATQFGTTVEQIMQINADLEVGSNVRTNDVVRFPRFYQGELVPELWESDDVGILLCVPRGTGFRLNHPLRVVILTHDEPIHEVIERFGTTVRDIEEVNGMAEDTLQYPGTPIAVPIADIYIVQRGDTLEGIAKIFNTPVWEIAEFNRIPDARELAPGKHLKVPPSASFVPTLAPSVGS